MSSKKTTVAMHWNGDAVKIQGKKVIGKSIFETGLVVEGQAKLLAAVNWGYLAASITVASSTDSTEPDSPSAFKVSTPFGEPPNLSPSEMKIKPPSDDKEVLVGTPVDYGPYVEFGTIKSMAQPFLRPALDLAKGKVMEIVQINAKGYFKEYLLEYNEYLRSRGKTPTIGGNLI